MNPYIYEKLQELEKETRRRTPYEPPRRKPVFGPVFRVAGRTLRRFGEGLESWAGYPPPEADQPQLRIDSTG